jgi:hypothetical protein
LSVSLFFCFVLCTYVVSFFVFLLRLVYLCCQFLCFFASSCVPYVVSFLVLLLRQVYPMLSVSWFFCFVMCTYVVSFLVFLLRLVYLCCQFLCFFASSFVETDNIGYTRRSNKTKKLTTYGTQDEAKKQRN